MGTRADRAHLYLFSFILLVAAEPLAHAATYLSLSDAELARRAPVIVRADVDSQETLLESFGGEVLASTRTTFRVLEVLKGQMSSETFELDLPGGKVAGVASWFPGTPDFSGGGEVILFLSPVAGRADRFRLTELGLSKFDIAEDSNRRRFAMRPAFSPEEDDGLSRRSSLPADVQVVAASTLRDADSFLSSLRSMARGGKFAPVEYGQPQGELRPGADRVRPLWVNIGGSENGSHRLFRWFWETDASPNGVVSVSGAQSNLSDGSDGTVHVQNATNAWRTVAASDVRYGFAAGEGNVIINLDVDDQGTAWSTPLSCGQGGVVGYGGPGPSSLAPNFKGEGPYYSTRSGTVWIRHVTGAAGCFPAGTFESAVLHEMGHTLGLGHPDQDASSHSAMCSFQTCTAVMRSTLTGALTPQPDDVAGIQWYYGTGGTLGILPAASFRAPPTTSVDESVQFTDTSTGGPTFWTWTFGDGGNSTAQNPTHLYLAAGVYAVRLTASNVNGSTIATQMITVTGCGSGASAPCRNQVRTILLCCSGAQPVPFRPRLSAQAVAPRPAPRGLNTGAEPTPRSLVSFRSRSSPLSFLLPRSWSPRYSAK